MPFENSVSKVCLQAGQAGRLRITVDGWPGFMLDDIGPALHIDGQSIAPARCTVDEGTGRDLLCLTCRFEDKAELRMAFSAGPEGSLRAATTLVNVGADAWVLNRMTLLEAGAASLGADHHRVRLFEQGNYWGRVVPLTAPVVEAAQGSEPNSEGNAAPRVSENVWVSFDAASGHAFLAGFETNDRWLGQISVCHRADETCTWCMGFDGGDLLVEPGETIALEEVVLLSGTDPWHLLESYADGVRDRHDIQVLEEPPVSWCSWYPYRLGVTEDRVLENAKVAAKRLKPLGLRVVEVDLGWEKDQLPSTFEENDQFPHGLAWLANRLAELGFDLGAWKAPFTISEFDPVVAEHPDWLVLGDDGKPVPYWTWFWQPHGNVYILDLTHPGALQWLRNKMQGLAARGVRYLKFDFIGCVSHQLAKRRHDPKRVLGGGVEAARDGAAVIREVFPDGLLLNCGGPEMPGRGHWPLVYTCNDTGNTGFVPQATQREIYQTLACHLFKNRRWGIVQPSCLCVGLPGTVEEARLRATAAFMAGGQIDVSDNLTALPEDRWRILEATLPVLPVTARPVDLFEPVTGPADYGYVASCQDAEEDEACVFEHTPGSVWHAHVASDWDEWDLVSVFSFEQRMKDGQPALAMFDIPLNRLGLSADDKLWAFEFWAGSALGTLPPDDRSPRAYTHPGDFQHLLGHGDPAALHVSFMGACAKLLCLRKVRPHPWVLGTTFHQSCGLELSRVRWDAAAQTLSGVVHRPDATSGAIVIAGCGLEPAEALVDDNKVTARAGAQGSWSLPTTVRGDSAAWSVRFA